MERRINTQNWDIFDYYRAIRAREKGIWQTIALRAGIEAGKNVVSAGINLEENVARSIK